MATLYIQSGESGSGLIIGKESDEIAYSELVIQDGGIVSELTVDSGGRAVVSSGGSLAQALVETDGSCRIGQGAVADGVRVSGGLEVVDGGSASDVIVRPDGHASVSGAAAMVLGAVVSSRGTLSVESGGSVGDATVYRGGELLLSQGLADGVTVFSGGSVRLAPGETELRHATVSSGGVLCMAWTLAEDSLTLADVTVVSGGSALVFGDATVTNLRMASGAVRNGFVLSADTVFSDGAFVFSGNAISGTSAMVGVGGSCVDIQVGKDVDLSVDEGGAASRICVCGGGRLLLRWGGVADGVEIASGASMYVGTDGARAADVTVFAGGSCKVDSGGTALMAYVPDGVSGGLVSAVQGAEVSWADESTAAGVYMHSNGGLTARASAVTDLSMAALEGAHVYAGGTMSAVVIGDGAFTEVKSGGCVSDVTIESGGRLSLVDCESASMAGVTLVSGGSLEILPDAATTAVAELIIERGGVFNGFVMADDLRQTGIACDFTGLALADDGAALLVGSGQTLSRCAVDDGRMIRVLGGLVDGLQLSGDGGAVTVERGGVLRTVTVSGGETGWTVDVLSGGLVSGASVSAGCTLRMDGGAGGQVTVGGAAALLSVSSSVISGVVVSSGGAFVLGVGGSCEDARVSSGGTAEVTGASAIGLIVCSGGSLALSSGACAERVTLAAGGTLSVASGATATVLCDGAGAYGELVRAEGAEVVYLAEVSRPSAPKIVPDVRELTTEPVTVTAAVPQDAALVEYSRDGASWSVYTAGIVCAKNETLYFRSVNAFGLVGEVVEYAVCNIQCADVSLGKFQVQGGVTCVDSAEAITLAVEVSNDGLAASGELTLEILVDGVAVTSVQVDALSAGERRTLALDAGRQSSGSHEISVRLGGESTACKVHVEDGAAAELAFESIAAASATVQQGEDITLDFTVRNVGGCAMAEGTAAVVWVDGAQVARVALEALAANGACAQTVVVTAEALEQAGVAWADGAHGIHVALEGENAPAADVTVYGVSSKLTVKEFRAEKGRYALGEDIVVSVAITNQGTGASCGGEADIVCGGEVLASIEIPVLAAGETYVCRQTLAGTLALGAATLSLNMAFKSAARLKLAIVDGAGDDEAPVITDVSVQQAQDGYGFLATVAATDDATPAEQLAVYLKVADNAAALAHATPVTGTAFTLSEADAGKTMLCQAGVMDAAGNIAWSDAVEFTVQDYSVGRWVTGVSAELADGDVRLSWDAYGADVSAYIVRYGCGDDVTELQVRQSECCVLTGVDAGRLWFQVKAVGADGSESVWSEQVVVEHIAADSCEPDDTAATAVELGVLAGSGARENLTLDCAEDVVFFRFTLAADGQAGDAIAIQARDGGAELTLVNAAGVEVLSAVDGRLGLSGVAAGSYMLKVRCVDGAASGYSLSYTIGVEAVADALEGNDSLGTAAALQFTDGSASQAATLHRREDGSVDVDCYWFELTETGSADDFVAVRFDGAAADVDLELLDQAGNVLASSCGTGGEERVSLAGRGAGVYYVRVSGSGAAAYQLEGRVVPEDPGADRLAAEGTVVIEETTTLKGLSISADETARADRFLVRLAVAGHDGNRITLTPERRAWGGMAYRLMNAAGTVVASGTGCEISLAGLAAGDYTLVVDTPVDGSYGAYDISVNLDRSAPECWDVFIGRVTTQAELQNALADVLAMQEAQRAAGVNAYVMLDAGDGMLRLGRVAFASGDACSVAWTLMETPEEGAAAAWEMFLTWGEAQSSGGRKAAVLGGSSADVSAVLSAHGIQVTVLEDAVELAELTLAALSDDAGIVVAASGAGATDYTAMLENLSGGMTAAEVADAMAAAVGTAVVAADGKAVAEALNAFAVASESFDSGDWRLVVNAFGSAASASGSLTAATSPLQDILSKLTGGTSALTAAVAALEQALGTAAENLSVFNPIQSLAALNVLDEQYGGVFETIGANWADFLQNVYLHRHLCTTARGDVLETTRRIDGHFDGGFVDERNLGAFSGGIVFEQLAVGASDWFALELAGVQADDALQAESAAGDVVIVLYDRGFNELARDVNSLALGTLGLADGVYHLRLLGDAAVTMASLAMTGAPGGMDRYDAGGGNDVLQKATQLTQWGAYSGLATSAGDADFYQMAMADSGRVRVTVRGAGLSIAVMNCAGESTPQILGEDGTATFDMAAGAWLCIEGTDGVSAYSLDIEAASDEAAPPVITLKGDNQTPLQASTLAASCDDSLQLFYNTTASDFDGDWTPYAGAFAVTENATYYFKTAADESGRVGKAAMRFENIDTVPPEAPQASADVTETTNMPVTVTAVFSGDSVIRQLSLDGENWSDYGAPMMLKDNATLYFRGIDAAGNISEVTVLVVANIVRIIPAAPVVQADVTGPTNGDVVVSAQFDANTVLPQFSLDGTVWQAYTEGIRFTANGTVWFRGISVTENESDIVQYVVDNIDKVLPEISAIAADVTGPTAGDVVVTAEFSDDKTLKSKEFRIDDGEWSPYEDGVVATANGVVAFRAEDAAGNVAEAAYEVANIDKTPPVISEITADATEPTNQDVTVTAVFADDVALASAEFRIGDGEWQAYDAGVVVAENCVVQFRAVDTAGNVTEDEYVVGNIDKILPTIGAVAASESAMTHEDVVVTAEFGDDVALAAAEYRIGEGEWRPYEDGVVVTENAWVHFRAVDTAGNVAEAEVEVANIDKIPPEAPSASADITRTTNQDVTVSAVFSEDSAVAEYSLDGEAWQAYAGGIVLGANGTVYFRGADIAGNVSDVTAFAVDWIDKSVPEAPAAAADTTVPTNGNVTVTASFSEACVLAEYSLDGESWQPYDGGIVFEANGAVWFRGTNEAGTASPITRFDVANIDKTAPEIRAITADATAPTNGNVTLTAQFADDVALASAEYRIGDGDWQACGERVVVTENCTVWFRATDTAGNCAEGSYVVANIDRVPPETPVPAADITAPTQRDVVVTAAFGEDAVVREFSLDGYVWQAYGEAGVTMTANGTVWFRSRDNAGNISDTARYDVANIDRTAPVITLSGETADPVQAAVLTASASEPCELSVSQDGRNWRAYTAPLDITANGTWYFRAVDAAGNVGTAEIAFGNIDRSAPVVTLVGDTETPARQARLSAIVDDGSALFYCVDGGEWRPYTSELEVMANGVYQFKATDAAGNTGTAEIAFGNIDRTAPVLTLLGDTESPRRSASLTATASESCRILYSCDGASWSEYTGQLEVTANATYYFQATDAAGNTGTAEITFGNIDRSRPDAPTAQADRTLQTAQPVTVTAQFSEDSVLREYSLDGGESWRAYEDGVVLAANGTVLFRGTDAAGNPSAETAVRVDNIIASDNWEDLKTAGDDGAFSVCGIVDEPCLVYEDSIGQEDAVDYVQFTLESAASLVFQASTANAAKLSVNTLTAKTDKKGVTTYSLKSLQTTSLKAGADAATKALLLQAGTYYIGMAAASKKAAAAAYSVQVADGSVFFVLGDNSDDWTDMKTSGVAGLPGAPVALSAAGDVVADGWVGYGDSVDYQAITIDSAARLALLASTSGAVKITVSALNAKTDSKGRTTYSLKTLQTTTLKAGATAETKALLLTAGTYYIGVTSTNAAKGGAADYKIALADTSAFFTRGDTSDDWNNLKVFGPAALPGVTVDMTPGLTLVADGWVGYGDVVDYMAVSADAPTRLSFDVTATDAAKFTIYSLVAKTNGKGVTTYSLKSLQTTTLKAGASVVTKDLFLGAGTYYIAMTSTNAAKGGNCEYTVAVSENARFYARADASDDTLKLAVAQKGRRVGEAVEGWVGYGDAVDYTKLALYESGRLVLTLDDDTAAAIKSKKLKMACYDLNGKTVKLTSLDGHVYMSAQSLSASVYYLGVTLSNPKQTEADYSIALSQITAAK